MTSSPLARASVLTPLSRAEHLIVRIEKGLVAAALALVLLTTVTQMVVRQLGGRSIGTNELAGLAMIVLVFVGASLAIASHDHITIELAAVLSSARLVRITHLVALCVVTGFAAVFTCHAARYLGYALGSGERSLQLGIPLTVGTSVMVLGGVLMFIHSILAIGQVAAGIPEGGVSTVEQGPVEEMER